MPNPENRTALHLACAIGDVNVVRSLLEMGANVHIKDRFNATPLTVAIDNHLDEVKFSQYQFPIRKKNPINLIFNFFFQIFVLI